MPISLTPRTPDSLGSAGTRTPAALGGVLLLCSDSLPCSNSLPCGEQGGGLTVRVPGSIALH